MKKTTWLLLFATVLTVATLALAGCGGGGSSSGKIAEVTMTDYKFAPNPITVDKGSVTLKITNKAAQLHDFTVAEFKVNVSVEPGKTVEQTVNFDKPGTYQIICNQPGHKDSGMVGQIIVK